MSDFIFFQYSFDNKTGNFDDLPARFGYRLPSDGLKVSKDESQRSKVTCSLIQSKIQISYFVNSNLCEYMHASNNMVQYI